MNTGYLPVAKGDDPPSMAEMLSICFPEIAQIGMDPKNSRWIMWAFHANFSISPKSDAYHVSIQCNFRYTLVQSHMASCESSVY